jgi:hypothetical protein
MSEALTQWIQFSSNIAGISIIVYFLFEGIKNWGGSPELKILKEQLRETNSQMKAITELLGRKFNTP